MCLCLWQLKANAHLLKGTSSIGNVHGVLHFLEGYTDLVWHSHTCKPIKIAQVWHGTTMPTSLLVLSRQSIDQFTFLVFRTHNIHTSNRHIQHTLSSKSRCLVCNNWHNLNSVVQTSGGGSGRRESALALLAGYENLLAHLKSQGALLNAVKPELLLDITDFRSALACAHNIAMHHDAFLSSGMCTQQCHAS